MKKGLIFFSNRPILNWIKYVIINPIRNHNLISELVEKANLTKNDLYPIIQTIFLGKTLATDDFELKSLDEERLSYFVDIYAKSLNENIVFSSKTLSDIINSLELIYKYGSLEAVQLFFKKFSNFFTKIMCQKIAELISKYGWLKLSESFSDQMGKGNIIFFCELITVKKIIYLVFLKIGCMKRVFWLEYYFSRIFFKTGV